MTRFFTFAICFFAVMLGIGAQETPPHAAPTPTTKSAGTITKLNGEQKTNEAQYNDPQRSPVPTCDGCFNSYTVDQPHTKTKEEESKEASLDRLYRCYLFATIIGVFGGFIGIGILVWQAFITRTAANAAKASADAARLNALAVINSERPWLVVTWASDKKIPGLFRFGCRNKGNTPAKVTRVSAKARFVNSQHPLIIPPDYSTPGRLPDLNIIVHGHDFEIEHGLNAESYIRDSGKDELVKCSGEFLVYYGNVVYRDTLYPEASPEGEHETRWCFFYQPDERKLLREGPKEYNRYT